MPLHWRGPRTVNLALQGGGAHGAFTWGVLDALLEDGRLRFEGVSGTSAGAMNAVLLAQGLMVGGPEGARNALRGFWSAVATSMPFEMATTTSDGQNVRLAPAMQWMLQWTQHFSPQQLNPFDLNPLRTLLLEQVDFERLRAHCPLKMFVAATQVNTGKLRLFRAAELTADAVLASACLPTLHRSVVIDGEAYWDGGYAANPAVFPLFHECRSPDIVLVMLAPLQHCDTPASAVEIQSRVVELAFNATFLREMRMFAHLRERARHSAWWRRGELDRRLLGTHFHVIEASAVMRDLGTHSKIATNMRFFERLFALGREHGRAWLMAHHADVGRRSSADLEALFY